MGELASQVAHAQRASAAFADIWRALMHPRSRAERPLASLPVTRKTQLLDRQKAQRAQDPMGGFATQSYGAEMPQIFASPGPIYEPEGRAADYWRTARAVFAAGFRAGDLIHNCFSYHFTPAGSMMSCAARAIGCTVFPGGTRSDRTTGAGHGRAQASGLHRNTQFSCALSWRRQTRWALPYPA